MLRELAEVIIARTDFDPGIRYANQRFGKIVVPQA
jgi:hypothetical protein